MNKNREKPTKKGASSINCYEKEKMDYQEKIAELKAKYKHLTPEEIVFSEKIEQENIPPKGIVLGRDPFKNYSVRKTLLIKIYNYSLEEAEKLIKTAQKAKEKAKLQTVKRDILKKANEIFGNIPSGGRESISEIVQREVWIRDGGKCVKCGSNEKLEFDHIIPVSQGGSNTARNIQLLCEKCNRSKGNDIG